jgi:hypothetical protein
VTIVTFYKNGFVITEHTRPDICSELSMFTWTVTQIMMNISFDYGKYVTDEVSGYGHFTFNYENPTLAHIFSVATQMLPIWAEKYGWISGGYISIINKDELFWPKDIVSNELPNEVAADKP